MKKLSTRQILERNKDRNSPLRNSFILWLHDIRSLHNVGAAFRSADAFGVKELWLSGFTPTPPRPEISKTAIGAEENVPWKQIQDVEKAVLELKKQNYLILGLEQTHQSMMIQDYKISNQPICLILGNEVTGIDDHLLPFLDDSIEIPQFGMKHSLNVSVAAGIALYAFMDKYLE